MAATVPAGGSTGARAMRMIAFPRVRTTPLLLALIFAGATPSWSAPPSLTVVTFNLWHDQHDWPKRLAIILTGLREVNPDVLCLQEVLQHETLRNQAETIADSLGYSAFFSSVDGEDRVKRYGNAILTRLPVLRTAMRKLEPLDDYRTVAHVRIDWEGTSVDVYDTHLHHTPEGGAIRATQIRDLLAFVDSTRGDGPVVLAGDFNARMGTPEMAAIAARYDDVFQVVHPRATPAEGVTYNPVFGTAPGAIDHVFVSNDPRRRLVPRTCEILFRNPSADSVWASDHFGVAARLEAARAKPGASESRSR